MGKWFADFLKTETGQNTVRVLFTTLGVSGVYLIIMSLAEETIKLEHNRLKKIKTKLKARIISIILGLFITFLISFLYYNENDNKIMIAQTLIFYVVSICVFVIFVSEKFKNIVGLIFDLIARIFGRGKK